MVVRLTDSTHRLRAGDGEGLVHTACVPFDQVQELSLLPIAVLPRKHHRALSRRRKMREGGRDSDEEEEDEADLEIPARGVEDLDLEDTTWETAVGIATRVGRGAEDIVRVERKGGGEVDQFGNTGEICVMRTLIPGMGSVISVQARGNRA
jgi:hypothetical protein